MKEDPHTGLWIEIGDERAWKKAGQALRESAPEIRAEQQAQLQAAVAAAGIVSGAGSGAGVLQGAVAPVGSGGKTSVSPVDDFCEEVGSGGEGGRRHHHHPQMDGLPGRRKNGGALSSSRSAAGGSIGGRSSRQASDPPGPRHRPNPPEREGLARPRQQPYQNTYEQEMYNDRTMNNSTSPYDNFDDRELTRMRQQHYSQLSGAEYNSQRMQQERLYAKQQHQGRYHDIYENYEHLAEQQIQQRMEQLTQEQYQLRQKKLLQQQQQQQQSRTYQPHEIAAALQNDDLLPVHAGFVIPSIRRDPQPPSQQEYEQQQMQKNYQQFQEQRRMQQLIQQQEQQQQKKGMTQIQGQRQGQYYHDSEDEVDDDDFIPHHSEAFDRFNPISSGASVSTMASFDVQSMDMSSIGNFSFNQSTNTFGGQSSRGDHNISMMSGLISTGSQMSRGSMARANKQRKSALERKLEKVNREHRRQQAAEEMEKRKMAAKQQGGAAGTTIPHQDLYQQQGTYQVPTLEEGRKKPGTSSNHHDYSFKSKMHDQSLNSFGFEAIEEDEMTEASYKLSNLGLSEMSMGTMTFNSDVLSIKSRADGGVKSSSGSNSTKDPSVEGTKRSGSEASASTDPNNPITASSLFDQSVSSNATSQKANNEAIDLANFNESFRSMDMEERGGAPLPDPDGVGARETSGTSSGNNATNPPRSRQKTASSTARASSRQQDPTGGRLPSVARASGATATTSGAPEVRKEKDNPVLDDFGVSFNSIASDASSWLNQYNSMENIGSDKNPWDDEESRG